MTSSNLIHVYCSIFSKLSIHHSEVIKQGSLHSQSNEHTFGIFQTQLRGPLQQQDTNIQLNALVSVFEGRTHLVLQCIVLATILHRVPGMGHMTGQVPPSTGIDHCKIQLGPTRARKLDLNIERTYERVFTGTVTFKFKTNYLLIIYMDTQKTVIMII